MNELVRDLAPRYVPAKFDRNRRRIAHGRALTELCLQTDNLIPVYPPFNFVEQGYKYGVLLQSMQRTWWPVASSTIVTGSYSVLTLAGSLRPSSLHNPDIVYDSGQKF